MANIVETETAGVKYFVDEGLRDRGVLVAFTTRLGGFSPPPYDSLNLCATGRDDLDNVEKNLRRLGNVLAVPFKTFIFAEQVHGHNVSPVGLDRVGGDPLDRRSFVARTDGMISSSKGLSLAVLTADCLSVILADPHRHVIAAVHAGWRGTLDGIVNEAVSAMIGAGADPANIEARLGPAIGHCCFEVGEDVYRRFVDEFDLPKTQGDHRLDLQLINKQVLLEAGVPGENIAAIGLCTKCRPDEFFSWRREKETGRQAAIVSLL